MNNQNTWAACGEYRILNSIYRSKNDWKGEDYNKNLEEGSCAWPDTAVKYQGECYDEDTFDGGEKTWIYCKKPGYFVNGIYKGDGTGIDKLNRFRCC